MLLVWLLNTSLCFDDFGGTLSYVGCHGYRIPKYKILKTLYLYKEPFEVKLEQIWYTYDKGFLR